MSKNIKHYMSIEDARVFLDAWAREENAIVYHNSRTFLDELIDYATESGSDWKAPGRLEQIRRLRDQDAQSALSRRLNHGGGNPPRYDKEGIREDVRQQHEADPELDWLAVTAAVAVDVERIDGDTFAKVRRRVRDYCHDMRW